MVLICLELGSCCWRINLGCVLAVFCQAVLKKNINIRRLFFLIVATFVVKVSLSEALPKSSQCANYYAEYVQ